MYFKEISTMLFTLLLLGCGGGSSSETGTPGGGMGTNSNPIANNDVASTEQNRSVVINPLLNDTDADGDDIFVSANTTPANGEVTLENDFFTYTPEDGYSGTDSFTYTLTDSFGQTSDATVNVEVSNLSPIAVDDSTTTKINTSIEVEPLSNDTDVMGDSLSLVSVSTPLNGSASIEDNIITYQPNSGFSGDDFFSYTIEDSYGASTSGVINIEVIFGVTLTGKVIGQEIADLDITFSYGTQEVIVQTDEFGIYQVFVVPDDTESLVTATVEHPTADYTYKAYFDDINTLIDSADPSYTVEGKNLSDLTTAEFELLQTISGSDDIITLEDLYDVRAQLVTTYQLELAIGAVLLYSSSDIVLPFGYSTINDLMLAPFEMIEQLSLWREEFPTLYYSEFEAMFNSDELTSEPDAITGSVIFQEGATSARLFTVNGLALNSDNMGDYLREGITKGEFSWERTDKLLDIDFITPFDVLDSRRRYCGTNSSSQITFSTTNMQYRYLYSTVEYDVYMRRNTGTFGDSLCLDNTVHTTEYDALKIYANDSLVVEPGKYYMESFRPNEVDENNEDESYHRVSALFEFQNDGSFSETIDELTDARSGQWSISDNSLILNYVNGLVVTYNKISDFDELPVLSYKTLEDGVLAAASNTFMLPANDSFIVDNTSGKYAFYENMLFDSNIDSLSRINFDDGTTGNQSGFIFGAWLDSVISIFSWQLTDNRYIATYYFEIDSGTGTGTYSNFCDVALDSCIVWRNRSFEILGKTDNYYIIKNYQEVYEEEGFFSPFRSGYISLFSFESN